MFDEFLKRPVAGLLTVTGTVLLTPVLLPAVARVARPLAKSILHIYFDLVHDVHKELTEYQSFRTRKKKPEILAPHALSEGAQKILVEDVETEAEESATEAIIETLVEVLE